MFQRDYMLRLIEQMTEAAGVMLGMKVNREPQQALLYIDELLKRMLGLNPKLLHGLTDAALLDLLRQGADGGTDKILIVAMLTKEEGDFHLMLGDFNTAYKRHCRALNLYLVAVADGADGSYINHVKDIDLLLESLRPYELPVAARERLWPYLLDQGKYADAENELFRLLEEGHGGEPLLEEALARYAKLRELDEAQLQAGGLSLDEVEDALEQLRGLQAKRGFPSA